METFLWSLLLAAITAISYFAYKHPKPFRYFFAFPLFALWGMIFASIVAYNMGGLNYHITTLPKNVEELKKIISEHSDEPTPSMYDHDNIKSELKPLESSAEDMYGMFSLIKATLAIGTAAVLYLLLLFFMPNILSFYENDESEL